MSKFKGIMFGIIIAILIFFAFFNSDPVVIKIIGEKVSFYSPIWAVVYVSVIIGILLGFLFRSRGKKPRQQD